MPCNAFFTLCNFFWGSETHQGSTFVATFRAEVDDMVGTFHHIKIMLDDQYRMPTEDECIECGKQSFDVMEMQACGRLVENEKGRGLPFLTDEIG